MRMRCRQSISEGEEWARNGIEVIYCDGEGQRDLETWTCDDMAVKNEPVTWDWIEFA